MRKQLQRMIPIILQQVILQEDITLSALTQRSLTEDAECPPLPL